MEKIIILYTTDLHGYLVSDTYFNNKTSTHGILHFVNYINTLRERGNEVILFDNGDLLTGSFTSYYYSEKKNKKNPIITILNQLKCSFSVLGNHDFDNGLEHIEQLKKYANFDFISCNIINRKNNDLYFKGSYIHTTKNKKKIAFIGATTPDTKKLIDKHIELEIDISNPAKAIKKQIKELEQDVDVIVVSYHGGYDKGLSFFHTDEKNICSNICKKNPEIDIFCTGHTHALLSNFKIGNTHTLQAGSYGSHLGKIDITFNKDSKKIESQLISAPYNLALEKHYEEKIDYSNKYLTRVICKHDQSYKIEDKNSIFTQNTRLIQFLHFIMKKYSPADITVAHYWKNISWDDYFVDYKTVVGLTPRNYISTIELNGEEIKKCLNINANLFSLDDKKNLIYPQKVYEFDVWSDIAYSIDLNKPLGKRVNKIFYKGEELTKKDILKVSFYHFRLNGAFGYQHLKKKDVLFESKYSTYHYICQYLENNTFPNIELMHNWEVISE